MTIIKLMAVVMLAGSVGITPQKAIPSIKNAAPVSYDLRVNYYYRVGYGTELWAYTSSGGGITQMVYWAQETTYWRSFVENSFYAAEFTWEMRIVRSASNDALFSLVSTGKYRYISPDGNLSYYNISGDINTRLRVVINDADYIVTYKYDLWKALPNSTGNGYNSVLFGNGHTTPVQIRHDLTTYEYVSSLSNPTYAVLFPGIASGQIVDAVQAYYFDLVAVANIEGEDWWDIYNAGVNNGYSAGIETGYASGLDAGRLENTAWEDAFTIIKGAIDTVGNVMAIQLFGPISIGTLVSIPLVVGLLFWIIDKWRGS